MSVELDRTTEDRRIPESLVIAVKVLGGTVLSGLAGYAAAKGIEHFVIDAEPSEVFEVAVIAGSALLGSFITAETIE